MALELISCNPLPVDAGPIAWECPSCGSHGITFTHTGATQESGKLIFMDGVATQSDQAFCAGCGQQVAHQVEGKGWLTIR